MNRARYCLDPGKKLVDAVADWLSCRARADPASGAASLAHVLVVVPTAQSGRALRLALARRFADRGLVPPSTVQPMRLVLGDEPGDVATRPQACAAFLAFLAAGPEKPHSRWPHLFHGDSADDHEALLSFFDQLDDLWRVLGSGGLMMRDVAVDPGAAELLESAIGDEMARWRELSSLEDGFFDFLHSHGLRHESERIRDSRKASPALDAEIEEIVLPALADPVPVLYDVLERTDRNVSVLLHSGEPDACKFDEWGRPLPGAWTGAARPVLPLRDCDIVRAAADSALAGEIAKYFPHGANGASAPELGLCDNALFGSLAAALGANGFDLHDPVKFKLSSSSLGRIAARLVSIFASGGESCRWDEFAALMREDDVLARVLRELSQGASPPSRRSVLVGMAAFRNAYFPRVASRGMAFDIEAVRCGDRGAVRDFARAANALFDIVGGGRAEVASAAPFVRSALAAIFSGRKPGRDLSGERELSAAADALRDVLDQFSDDAFKGFAPGRSLSAALLRKGISDATYSLEPDSPSALRAVGWLDLSWSGADRILLAGFNEGDVPDSITGHPFLPESLRAKLGLQSNDARLARDTFLLKEMLDARAEGAVRACFARTSDSGDIHRPSRLLFLVRDADLAARVKCLFGELPSGGGRAPRAIADGWRPRLPSALALPHSGDGATPGGRLSASHIDSWLRCPFSCLLSYGMGMERTEEKDEFGADDFGNFVHAALEEYAKSQIERDSNGLPQLREEADIRAALADIFGKIRARHGEPLPAKLELQLDSVQSRLENFAAIQAMWASNGWKIVARPEFGFTARPFRDEDGPDVWIRGFVDRIDFKEGTGYRLIDYKTWDSRSAIVRKIVSSGAAEAAHAMSLGLPLLQAARCNAAGRRILSVQLPLYARCLETMPASECGHLPTDGFAGHIADCCYLVLGKNPENTCVFGSSEDQGDFESQKRGKLVLSEECFSNAALDTARIAIRAIRRGLYWPPGPGNELKYGLGDILLNSAESDMKGTPWLAEQEARMTLFAAEMAANATGGATAPEREMEAEQ